MNQPKGPKTPEKVKAPKKVKKPKKRNLNNLLSKNITKFPSTKADTSPTMTESPLEADFCYYLEFDKEVIRYESQPLEIPYWYDGEKHWYTPDFEAFYEKSSCYYEIKYKKDIERDDEFELRFAAQKKSVQELGKDLFLITDEFITKQYMYENLCLLYKFSKISIDPEFLYFVKTSLQSNRELFILDLLREDTKNEDFQKIYKLIWMQFLRADLESEVLSTHASIQLN
jgi:hypothetical protein